MADKLWVVEHGDDMVIAEHFTSVLGGANGGDYRRERPL